MKKNWYAIYTKPNCEKKVVSLLAKKKIENYCPINRIVTNGYVNKKRTIQEPLLDSFVFVHINENQIEIVKQINFVVNFVYWLGKPATIQNNEISNLQNFTNEFFNIRLEKTVVKPNEASKVTSEPHIDINGKVMSLKNTHIKLSLPSLGYIVIAEVDKVNADVFHNVSETNKLVY